MDYLATEADIDLIQDRLEDIGKLSLLGIKEQEQISKDDVWERAVEINKIGQELYLKISRLPKN